jgi:hypothetical protein
MIDEKGHEEHPLDGTEIATRRTQRRVDTTNPAGALSSSVQHASPLAAGTTQRAGAPPTAMITHPIA